MRKKGGKKKENCFHKRRFLNSCVLLRFENTLGLKPSSAPPSREHTRMGTSPTTY